MRSPIKIDHSNRKIILMDKKFAEHSNWVDTQEYVFLQIARADYPDYEIVERKIKKCEKPIERYKGLTYAYMERYIALHNNALENMKVYQEMKLISECHSIKYPVIKAWFLEQYPEIEEFGMPVLEDEAIAESSVAQVA